MLRRPIIYNGILQLFANFFVAIFGILNLFWIFAKNGGKYVNDVFSCEIYKKFQKFSKVIKKLLKLQNYKRTVINKTYNFIFDLIFAKTRKKQLAIKLYII